MFFVCIIGLALFCLCADSTTCPSGGFVCYPTDCGDQYQRCEGNIFYPPEYTPRGLLCKEGQLVFPSSCSLSECPQPSCSLSQIFSESDFNRLFPYANGGANNAVANQYLFLCSISLLLLLSPLCAHTSPSYL